MKVKGLKSKVEQITFEGDHPTSGLVSSEPWHRLRNLIAAHYKDQAANIVSFKITPSSLEIYWKEYHPRA